MVTVLPPDADEPVAASQRAGRRRVIAVLAALVLVAAAGAAGWLLRGGVDEDPTAVPVGHVSDFPSGSVKERVLDVGHYDSVGVEGPLEDATAGGEVASTRLFIVNHPESGFLAVLQRSPWLGCRVVEVTAGEASDFGGTLPAGFERGFRDPCHGGLFSLDGQRLAGPGERDLDQFPIRYLPDGTLVVDVTNLQSTQAAEAVHSGTTTEPVTPVASTRIPTTTTAVSRVYEEVFAFDTSLECDPGADDADVQVVEAFFTAYNERNMQRLKQLIETDEIWDPAGVAHSGQVLWTDATGWALGGWESDDHFELVRLVSYGPAAGSDITLIRTNRTLAAAGIESLVVGFKVPSSGCTIDRLVGHVSPNVTSNCDFFAAFTDDLNDAWDQEWTVPDICTQ